MKNRKFYLDRKGRVIHNIKEGDVCPYCNVGDVVIRKGKYNNFYACSHFPACGFTQQIKYQEKDEIEEKANKYLRRVDK